MTGRIPKAFETARAEGRPALITYLMCGDPDYATSMAHIEAMLAEGGADIVEIGVAFSDPVADGPVIQKAGVRALDGGAKPADALRMVRELRAKGVTKPLVLMTYYNPIYRVGLDAYAAQCKEAGVDGLIVPDLPLEESGPLRDALDAADVALIQLASPATPPERVARLAEATRGFLYLVSSFGVTGARSDVADKARGLVSRVKEDVAGKVPVAVGFGVSSPEHVQALGDAGADGVIVGSALVKRVEDGMAPDGIGLAVKGLRSRAV